MPKRIDISSILIIGAGPIVIGRATMAALLALTLVTGCAVHRATAQPDRDAIFRKIVECGLRAENVTFEVDEEGVDNAEIFPASESDETYRAGVNCLMEWAAGSGAAMAFDVAPRGRQ